MHMTHDEFISEAEDKLTKATVDEIAKVPGYIHSVLVLSAMRRIAFSEQVQANMRRVIAKQSMEMGLALYSGGQWSRQEAVEVAKCWIELFHNTSDSAYLIADTDTQKTDALLEHAHAKASELVETLFDDSQQAGYVKRACAWLRENRTGIGIGKPPPSDAPDSIHTGVELLKRLLFGTIKPAPPAEILPGWKRGKLVLKSQPNGDKPAVFAFGNKSYTVPSRKAWDTVCALIRADAFDGHGLHMPSPSEQFKRLHRPFFTDRLTQNDSGWYIKTQ